LSLPSFPYLTVYQVSVNAVKILAVFHTARDLAGALDERKDELRRKPS